MGYYLPPVCRFTICILNQFFLMKAALGAMLPGAACVLLGCLNRQVRVEESWGDESDLPGLEPAIGYP